MTESSDNHKDLLARLEELSSKHLVLQLDVIRQRHEINELKELIKKQKKLSGAEVTPAKNKPDMPVETSVEKLQQETVHKPVESSAAPEKQKRSLDLEEFIGGNLINKVGILILIIGVGIGVKYAIDHDWISPAMRIFLGYMVGLGLMGFGLRLKVKYENFSAVLMSGSMAIFYFISYAAHVYYELIPIWMSFALMAGITGTTIYLALNYNAQVIAHIGLVGAYTIPFLFLETNERPEIFFPFMAVINGGILILSLLKQWKPLFYSSFLVTWIIFVSWFILHYNPDEHFVLTMVILPVFFTTFYVIFLVYKLIRNDKINFDEVLILLANSFILFGFGLSILNGHNAEKELLATFTIANALIHGGAFVWLIQQKSPDRVLRFLILGLALLFVTVAVPIELEGNWITIVWLAECLILFGIGRIKKSIFIERVSYLVIIMTSFQIVFQWAESFNSRSSNLEAISPFINFSFLTACLAILVFGSTLWLHRNKKYLEHVNRNNKFYKFFNIILPVILISLSYFAFRSEIASIFNKWYFVTKINLHNVSGIPGRYSDGNYDIFCFKSFGLMIYTIVFVVILSILNIKRYKNNVFGNTNLIINGLVLVVVFPTGLYLSGILRESYMNESLSVYYNSGAFHIIIRYIFIAFVGLLLWVSYEYARQEYISIELKVPLDVILYISLLVVASTELIQWLDFSRGTDSYKLELSILWGLFAVMLIAIGIWKKKKHLRIMAIILFSGTLLKVFLYDIAHLDTISKTIVLIILGILMLITSYLYIKYRTVLFGSEEKTKEINQSV